MSTWTLKALGADDCDIPLDFSGSSSVTVGRRDLRTCSEANHVSSQHLEFHTCMSDASALVVIARSKFDVVFVHGKLLAKDQIDFVQNGTIISMCGKLFSYTLRRHINASTIKLETKTKKRKIDETIDFAPNSCASANDMRDPPPQCGSELAEASAAMALEDVLSAVYNRSHTAFANTRSLARELLSSFQCDICLELIAGSRSCVPCGHSFCVACITNYMAVKRQG